MGVKKELLKNLTEASKAAKKNLQTKLTEFEQAHIVAQQNASLPIEQGGLGLPANNTAMDRARAMGFDVANMFNHNPGYRFYNNKEEQIQKIRVGDDTSFDGIFTSGRRDYDSESENFNNFFVKKHADHSDFIEALRSTDSNDAINKYIDTRSLSDDQKEVIKDLITEEDKLENYIDYDQSSDVPAWLADALGIEDSGYASWELQRIRGRIAADMGFDAVDMYDETGVSTLLLGGRDVRNINAAFDPPKKDSSNLLASAGAGTAVLGGSLLTPEENQAQAGWINKGGKQVLETWHGTPHEFPPTANNPLGEFDLSKIGTGEGAQAYGHGIYQADVRGVAEGYKKNVGFNEIKKQFRNNLPDDADFDDVMDLVNSGAMPKKQADIYRELEKDDWLGFDYPSQAISALFSNDRGNFDISDSLAKVADEYGSLYRTHSDIQPEEMLDWDKPLSEQSDAIRNSISAIASNDVRERIKSSIARGDYQSGYGVIKEGNSYLPVIDGEVVSIDGVNDLTFSSFDDAYKHIEPDIIGKTNNIATGADAYRALVGSHGGAGQGQLEASNYLNSLGIKGIQYDDGLSRGKEGVEKTKNYVIFDPSRMNIVEKGNATPKAMGTLAALSGGANAIYNAAKNNTLGEAANYAQDAANMIGYIPTAGMLTTSDIIGGIGKAGAAVTGNLDAYNANVSPYIESAGETKSQLGIQAENALSAAMSKAAPYVAPYAAPVINSLSQQWQDIEANPGAANIYGWLGELNRKANMKPFKK